MAGALALPFGHWLTGQHVVRRQIWGAAAVVAGLSLFVLVGDPNDGVDTPSSRTAYFAAMVAVSALAGVAILRARRVQPSRPAGLLGIAAGVWFGLSATFTKATIEQLHHGIGYTLSHPDVYGLLGFGAIALVVQQLSLATGELAPAMAAVSVANPVISVLLGILLFDERLTRPWWHVIVASLALLGALYGAVLITMSNRELALPGQDQSSPASPLTSR